MIAEDAHKNRKFGLTWPVTVGFVHQELMIGLEDKVSSSLFHSIARPFAVWSRYIGSVLDSPIHCTTLLPTTHPRLFKAPHALPLYSPSAHYFPSYSRRTFRLSASKTPYKPSQKFKLPRHLSKPKHFHWYSIVVTHPSFRPPWPSGFHRCLDTFYLQIFTTFVQRPIPLLAHPAPSAYAILHTLAHYTADYHPGLWPSCCACRKGGYSV